MLIKHPCHPAGHQKTGKGDNPKWNIPIPSLGGGNSNIFGIFTPKIGEDEPILTSIFSDGFFIDNIVCICIYIFRLCFVCARFWADVCINVALNMPGA